LGPTVHWWIRRREDAVKTAHGRHCKHTELPRFGTLVRRQHPYSYMSDLYVLHMRATMVLLELFILLV
jgi:hypothetical protein